MIGIFLTLITALGACGLAAVALENLQARRIRVPVRESRPPQPDGDSA